jgi:hypothetical protein
MIFPNHVYNIRIYFVDGKYFCLLYFLNIVDFYPRGRNGKLGLIVGSIIYKDIQCRLGKVVSAL